MFRSVSRENFSKILLKIFILFYLLTRVMSAMQSVSPRKDFVLTNENSSIIRSIILSRERDGCTLDQIKCDYLEHEGVKLHHKHGDNELRKIIGSIEFVRSCEKSTAKGTEIFYYSQNPKQEHLAKMIRKQKPSAKNTPPKGGREYTNSNRKGKFFNHNQKRRSNSSTEGDFSLHSGYESMMHSEVREIQNDSAISSSTMDESIVPTFHGCPMIGDDFFHTLATNDLGFPRVNHDSKLSSTCMNGLTIRMGQSKLEHIETGSIIIVNLGSNDVLNDRPLVALMEDMAEFLSTCNKKQIIPILTTLAPLPTYHLGNRRETLTNFNRFIKVNPFNYPVIDLHPSFIVFGKIELHAYQPEPRHAVGYKKKIMMWNKVGRKRVLQKIADYMGAAIVDIYTYYAHYKIDALKWHCEKSEITLGRLGKKI